MQKVLVVDDELISRESTVMLIKKYLPQLEVVGTCRSGKDAIEKNYNLRPDIMIMDINMPGINGLDAMRQIKQVNKNVSFVVLSAFDYFDYAKEAMEIGAFFYMLKPVKRQEFIDTMKKVIEKVEENRKDMLDKIEFEEKRKKILPILENNFIASLCLHEQNTEVIREQFELLEKDCESGYVMTVEIRDNNELRKKRKEKINYAKDDSKKIDIMNDIDEQIYAYCKGILKQVCDCVIGPIISKRFLVYVCDNKMNYMSNQEKKEYQYDLANKFVSKISKEQGEVYIGIGEFTESLDDIKKSFDGAHNSLSNIIQNSMDSKVMHIDDVIKDEKTKFNRNEKSFYLEVYTPLKNEENSRAQIGFEKIFLDMVSNNIKLDALKNIVLGYIVELNKKFKNPKVSSYDIIGDILECPNEKILCGVTKKYIGELVVKQVVVSKHKKAILTIEKIDKYIEEHYKEDITLEQVAKLVNFSSYYLSRFYKNETGTNFSDKIMQVRISEAKKLFLNSEANVKDVTYMVGYSDPNYFSKIFKRVTGCTVSEFKKKNGI